MFGWSAIASATKSSVPSLDPSLTITQDCGGTVWVAMASIVAPMVETPFRTGVTIT